MPPGEFLTMARTLGDDSGYDHELKEETLWDKLLFGRKDAISKGNSLSLFKQVYDLAKTEESTKAQMQAIAQAGHDTIKHSGRRKKKPDTSAALTEHTAWAQIDGRMTRDTKYHLQTSPGSN